MILTLCAMIVQRRSTSQAFISRRALQSALELARCAMSGEHCIGELYHGFSGGRTVSSRSAQALFYRRILSSRSEHQVDNVLAMK